MTDDLKAVEDGEQEPNFGPAPEMDWFLQTLVDDVASRGVEIGLTLHIAGGIVSGTLISGDKYFKGIAEEVGAGAESDDDVPSQLSQIWAQYAEIYSPAEGNSSDQQPPSMFLHLKEARFHLPGAPAIPENRGVFWRTRLSEVSGFAVGVLSGD